MFHQVFICDTTEEVNIPTADKDNINLTAELDEYKDVSSGTSVGGRSSCNISSKSPPGAVNLERSYQICQAAIYNSPNWDQLRGQLKPPPSALIGKSDKVVWTDGTVNLERSNQICQAAIQNSPNWYQLHGQLKPLPSLLIGKSDKGVSYAQTNCDKMDVDLVFDTTDAGHTQNLVVEMKPFPAENKVQSNVSQCGQTLPEPRKQCYSKWITSMNKQQIQDELRKLGLDVPSTIDMCRTVLRSYVKSHPLDENVHNFFKLPIKIKEECSENLVKINKLDLDIKSEEIQNGADEGWTQDKDTYGGRRTSSRLRNTQKPRTPIIDASSTDEENSDDSGSSNWSSNSGRGRSPSIRKQNSNVSQCGQTLPEPRKQCYSKWITSMNKQQIQDELRKLGLDVPSTRDMCRTVLRSYVKSHPLNENLHSVTMNNQQMAPTKSYEIELDPLSDILDVNQSPTTSYELEPLSATLDVNQSPTTSYELDPLSATLDVNQSPTTSYELDPLSATLDVNQSLNSAVKLELPDGENKTHSDILHGSEINRDNEVKEYVLIKSYKIELDSVDENKTPKSEVKFELADEENEAKSDIFLSLPTHQSDEALNRDILMATSEEISNLSKISKIKSTITHLMSCEESIKHELDTCCENFIGALNSNKGEVAKSITIQESGNSKNFTNTTPIIQNQTLQANKRITNTNIPVASLKDKNTLNGNSPNVSEVNNLSKGSSHLLVTENKSFSVEDDSGSDWEQEYFELSGVDLKSKYSKGPCKSNVIYESNLNCTNSGSLKKITHDENNLKNIFSIKPSRVLVHQLKDPIELKKSKTAINLNGEDIVDNGEALFENSIKIDKINKNSKIAKISLNKYEIFCNVCKLITKTNHNCHSKSAKCNESNKLIPSDKVDISNVCKIITTKANHISHFKSHEFNESKKLIPLEKDDICKSLYINSEKINNHYINKNLTTEKKCIDCNKYFSDKYWLKKHIKHKHPERMVILEMENKEKKIEIKKSAQSKKFILCKNCCKPFKTQNQLSNHKRTLCYGYKRSHRHQCDVCGKLFPGKEKLQNHKNSHTNSKPYKCIACEKCFNSKEARHMHFKNMHKKNKISKLLCSFCGITHNNLLHMLAHEEAHRLPEGAEIPTAFRCLQCGKGYISKFKLTHHLNEHRKKNCPQCSEKFETQYVLRVHLRDVHNIRKKYNCKICEKTFECPKNLRSHALVHSSVLPFSCEVCGKCFKKKAHIRQHMITHSEERPLSCPDCGDCFKRITHLNQHVAAIHGKVKNRKS